MPTHIEIARERELLTALGIGQVSSWPPRCTWYRADGGVAGTLPCDPYSRVRYMSRGFRPDVADHPARSTEPGPVSLMEAVVSLMCHRDDWEGTASELLSTLEPVAQDLPVDSTRLSKALFGLASRLAARGIAVERTPRGRQRGIRLSRR